MTTSETAPVPITRATHLLDLTVTLLLLGKAKLVSVSNDPQSGGRNRYVFTLGLNAEALTLFEAWTNPKDPRFASQTIPLSVANRVALGSRVAMQWITSRTTHQHRDIVPEVWENFTRAVAP